MREPFSLSLGHSQTNLVLVDQAAALCGRVTGFNLCGDIRAVPGEPLFSFRIDVDYHMPKVAIAVRMVKMTTISLIRAFSYPTIHGNLFQSQEFSTFVSH